MEELNVIVSGAEITGLIHISYPHKPAENHKKAEMNKYARLHLIRLNYTGFWVGYYWVRPESVKKSAMECLQYYFVRRRSWNKTKSI